MRISTCILTTMLLLGSANAKDIGEEASFCFNPPTGTATAINIVFDVQLDAIGNVVDAKVQDGWQPTEEAVMAALRAVQLCGPYREIEGHEVTATFAPYEPLEIDPFD